MSVPTPVRPGNAWRKIPAIGTKLAHIPPNSTIVRHDALCLGIQKAPGAIAYHSFESQEKCDEAFRLLTEPFPTTAIYPNRQRDKTKVETLRHLREEGDHQTEFRTSKGNLFATGYTRIVYGDHGPYIEFENEDIVLPLRRRFNRPAPAHCYYEWLEPQDGSGVKVYSQLRDVKNLPNPPRGGFFGNRPEGYADYKPGFIYVSPYELTNTPNLHLDQP